MLANTKKAEQSTPDRRPSPRRGSLKSSDRPHEPRWNQWIEAQFFSPFSRISNCSPGRPHKPPEYHRRTADTALSKKGDSNHFLKQIFTLDSLPARPATCRPNPTVYSKQRTGKRASSTSGSVIAVLVICTCTADSPSCPMAAPEPPPMVS